MLFLPKNAKLLRNSKFIRYHSASYTWSLSHTRTMVEILSFTRQSAHNVWSLKASDKMMQWPNNYSSFLIWLYIRFCVVIVSASKLIMYIVDMVVESTSHLTDFFYGTSPWSFTQNLSHTPESTVFRSRLTNKRMRLVVKGEKNLSGWPIHYSSFSTALCTTIVLLLAEQQGKTWDRVVSFFSRPRNGQIRPDVISCESPTDGATWLINSPLLNFGSTPLKFRFPFSMHG
jgi:hypothetical protein